MFFALIFDGYSSETIEMFVFASNYMIEDEATVTNFHISNCKNMNIDLAFSLTRSIMQ